MKRNVGSSDRVARVVAAVAAIGCAVAAPLPLGVRLVAFGATGVYFAATAVFGRCLGYTVMGRSTCAIHPPSSPR